MKIVVHGTGDGLRHARRRTERFKRCLADLLQAAEVPQELGLALLAHAWDVFQSGMQLLALTQGLVIGDCETVRFVTQPLQQKQGRRIDRKEHCVLAPGTIKFFVAVAAGASVEVAVAVAVAVAAAVAVAVAVGVGAASAQV